MHARRVTQPGRRGPRCIAYVILVPTRQHASTSGTTGPPLSAVQVCDFAYKGRKGIWNFRSELHMLPLCCHSLITGYFHPLGGSPQTW
jgi:hypothetical protein